jgi:hypothetical protein
LPAYNKRLEKIGVRLEPLAASCCPPDQTSLWIAGISVPGDDQGHAIVCRGYGIVHDSLGQFTGLLPMDQLLDGFVLRPTERVVRSFSPAGSGYAVVAA